MAHNQKNDRKVVGVNKEHQLRDLLHQRAKEASDKALQTEGQISAEQVKALLSLARLVEICDATQPPSFRRSFRKRQPILVLLLVAVIILSLLFFVSKSEMEIELDLTTSEVSFSLPTSQVLTDVMALSTLGLSGMREIRLPSADGRTIDTLFSSDDANFAMRLSVISDKERRGTINLTTFSLPAGTRVSLFYLGVPHQYRLSLNNIKNEVSVDVNGPVQIQLSGTQVEQRSFTSPKALLFRPDLNEIDMDFVLPEVSDGAFSPQILVRDLSFFRVNEFVDADNNKIIRSVSTVLSGSLYFDELNGEKYVLRLGEGIRFARAEGEIRTLQLNDDHIALQFHGRVRGMSTGSSENRRSLMPTWFDWLKARQGLYLFWGAIVSLFSLILGVLHWWRT